MLASTGLNSFSLEQQEAAVLSVRMQHVLGSLSPHVFCRSSNSELRDGCSRVGCLADQVAACFRWLFLWLFIFPQPSKLMSGVFCMMPFHL